MLKVYKLTCHCTLKLLSVVVNVASVHTGGQEIPSSSGNLVDLSPG